MNRKVIIHLILSVACLGLFSCSESEYIPSESASLVARYLASSESSLKYSAEASTKNIQVSTVNTNWSITNTASWVTASPSRGNANTKVNISVSENFSADTARATVDYLSSENLEWPLTLPISIIQYAASPKLVLSTDNLTFTGAASTKTVNVSSNYKWTCNTDTDWITASPSSDQKTLDVKVTENTTGSSRSGNIILSGKNSTFLNVTQAAAKIEVSTPSLNFENTAGTYSLMLESETFWTAKSSDTWIQIMPKSGNAGKNSMSISVSPNESISDRNGFIYLNIGDKEVVEIPIHQDGFYLSCDQSLLDFDSNSEQQILNVKSNLDWIVSAQPEWVTISQQYGHNNCDLIVSVTDNNSIQKRSGIISLSAPGLSIEKTIEIRQKGKFFSVENTNLLFSDKASTAEVSIITDGTWSAITDEDWISISPTNNTGNSIAIVSVAENTSDDERDGNITISLGNKAYTIAVHQSGKYFNVPSDGLEYKSTGGVIHLSVSTNDHWIATLEKNSSWLKVTPSEGSGSVDLLITASDNPSVNERKEVLSISTTNGHNVKVNIVQKARYLSASAQSINFFSKGGKSELITISTDGEFQIIKDCDWFTIQEESERTFAVIAGKNETGLFRDGFITIKLIDLQDGEMYLSIPVSQIAPGAKFDKDGYKEDVRWDATGKSSFVITNEGYSSDANLDQATENILTIILNGYNNDSDFDESTISSFTLLLKGYSGDNWWGTFLDGAGILDRHGYRDDKNHNTNGSNSGIIDKGDYEGDSKKDHESASYGNITNVGYEDDKNHDFNNPTNGSIIHSNYKTDINLDNIE